MPNKKIPLFLKNVIYKRQNSLASFDAASGEILSEKMKLKDWKNFFASEKIENHFLWITWNDIKEIAASAKDDLKAQQIVTAIDFHSGVSKVMPIFSQLLFALAARQEPLYHFYNGGCGNATVRKYEKMFLKEIGESNSERAEYWTAWHELANHHRELLNNLTALEEARRKAIADGDEGADSLKDIQKQIKDFYRKCVDGITPRNTTRKAFELAGDSSQLEDFSEFFIQRSKVEKVNSQTKKEEKMNDKKSDTAKETVAEMIKRIAKENNYEDVRLPETDLLGEDVAIELRYDGLWSAQFFVGNSPAYFVYFDEKGELDYDHTVWCEFDTPEEALEALDEQCKEMKLRNAILISQDQMQGDGYYKDEDENDDNECDDDHENDEDLDALKNNLIELLKKQNPALSKLEDIETENELELKSMIGKLPDNWEEMTPEEKLGTVYNKFELLNDSDMYRLTLHGGFDWNEVFEVWLALEANEDHQFTEMGACIALTEPCAEDEFDFNKFPEYLHPIIKEKCNDDYNILYAESNSGTFAEAAESMYFMLDLLTYGYELTEREWYYEKHPDLYPDSIDDEEDFDDDDDEEEEEEDF